jgi:hypothetical protein
MILTLVNPLQPKNCDKVDPVEEVCAVEMAWFRPAGIVTLVRFPHEAKAPGPSVITVSGIENSFSLVQPLNA